MAYLAIDTSTQTLTIAVGERSQLLGEASAVVKKNHSNRLLPMIEALLSDLELAPEDLQGIVVGQGPGSYTGVRVGVTTGKMLAWALKIPLAGVSSLDGLALHFQDATGLICPMFDARRQQAYCAVYERLETDTTRVAKVEPDALRKLDTLFSLLAARLEQRQRDGQREQVIFVGDGAIRYRELIEARFGEQAVVSERGASQLVRAAYLLDEGITRIEAGDTDVAESFVPEYLQLVEAEAKLLEKTGQLERNVLTENRLIADPTPADKGGAV